MQGGCCGQSRFRRSRGRRGVVNATGLMYYFLGLERRAKKWLLIRLVWCLGGLARAKDRAPVALACDTLTVDWATDSPLMTLHRAL